MPYNTDRSLPEKSDTCCDTPDCCSGGTITRRLFIGKAALATAGAFFLPRLIMAGPFEPGDFQKFVPVDKKLADAWIKSLFERGTPTI
jgi:hypothetical protein